MKKLKEGMSLTEFIEELQDIAKTEDPDAIEVVALSEVDEPYTPVISLMTDADGVRRLRVA